MKKRLRIISLLLVCVLIAGIFPMAAFAQETVTEISAPSQLRALAGREITGNYRLTADLNMTGKPMEPIKKLSGSFDGCGHTISNLTIVGNDAPVGYTDPGAVGLFGRANGNISNLRLQNLKVSTTQKRNMGVGGLVGVLDGGALTLTGCGVTGSVAAPVEATSCYTGSLVGDVIYGSSILTMENCFSTANVTTGTAGGGLVGRVGFMGNVRIKDCAAGGKVTAEYGGGIIGYCLAQYNVQAENCYFTGSFSKNYAPNLYVFGYTSAIEEAVITLKNCGYDRALGDGRPVIRENTAQLTGTMQAMSAEKLATLTKDIFAWPKEPSVGPGDDVIPDTYISVNPENALLEVHRGTNANGPVIEPKQASGLGMYVYDLEKGTYYYTVEAHDYQTASGTFEVSMEENRLSIELKKVPGWEELASRTIAKGNGKMVSPYQISSAEELACFANKVNGGEYEACAELTADIDLKDIPWHPIGENATTSYRGFFNGKNFTVSGLNVSRDASRYFGLFGCLEDASIRNLTVSGSVYDPGSGNRTGGLAGHARHNVTVENCANLCSITAGASKVGGLIGDYDKGVEFQTPSVRLMLKRCYNAGNLAVTGSDPSVSVGGLVGGNKNCVQMEDCYNTGIIKAGKIQAGGLLGDAGSTTGECRPGMTNCYNAGPVSGAEGSHAIWGKGTMPSSGLVNCYAIFGSGAEQKDITFLAKEELTAEMLGKAWAQAPDKNDGLPYLSATAPETGDDTLMREAEKYFDSVSVPGTVQTGTELTLLKPEQTPDPSIEMMCVQTENDHQRGYLDCRNGTVKLRKNNTSAEAVTETLTLRFRKDGVTFYKSVLVLIYPTADQSSSLMEKIAASYVDNSTEWVIFDMAVYGKVFPDAASKTGADARKTYLDTTINETLNHSSDEFIMLSKEVDTRTKGEIILGTLGVDTRSLTAWPGTDSQKTYSNADAIPPLLGKLNTHYSAPWVLLAAQQGKIRLTGAQIRAMIQLLADNQQENGLNCYSYYGRTYDDVDTTAAAIAAMAEYYLSETDEYGVRQMAAGFISRALEGMSNAQMNNGSYGNVNTDAMAIIGLTALGIDPEQDPRFVKGGCSLAAALSLYVNDTADGYSAGMATGKPEEIAKANALATEQGFRAMVTLEAFRQDKTRAYNVYTQRRTDVPAKLPDGTETICVTFSLEQDPEQTPWIPTAEFTVPEGATAYDLLCRAVKENNMTFTEKNGYITSVTKDGVTFKAGEYGPNSGWMYDVNGKLPGVPLSGWVLSAGDRVSFFYVRPERTEAPVISPEGGQFAGVQKVAITCPDAEAEIFYTLDGSEPSAESLRYEKPFEIFESTTVKAIAQTEGLAPSAVVSADFTAVPCTGGDSCPCRRFTDLNPDKWYHASVDYVLNHHYMVGANDTCFQPDGTVSRAMFVTILYRIAGKPGAGTSSFRDVPQGKWYSDAISWAADQKIAAGFSDGTFRPEESVTREQLAAFLYRYADRPETNGSLDGFADAGEAGKYAVKALQWAVENRILYGKGDDILNPAGTAVRAEAAAMMTRFDRLSN